ncbi:hypothetical protein COLO4_01550, partial [Corchorus olitorius]
QPDAAGGHGPARAGHGLHQPGRRRARTAHARGHAQRAGHHQEQALRPHRPRGGRALHRQRHGGPAGHGRLHQPPDPLGGGGARCGHHHRLERFFRALGRGAAAGPRLSQWQRRREPVPGRRRSGLCDRPVAQGRPHAWRCAHRAARWPAGVRAHSGRGQRPVGLARGRSLRRPVRAAPCRCALQRHGRAQAAVRQPGAQRDQGQRRARGPPCGRGARTRLRLSGSAAAGLQGRRTGPRCHLRCALAGAVRQWHARAAQAHSAPGRAAGQGLQGGPGHGRPHERRLGQGACGHPRLARGLRGRAAGAPARWRPGAPGRRGRHPGRAGR